VLSVGKELVISAWVALIQWLQRVTDKSMAFAQLDADAPKKMKKRDNFSQKMS